MDTPDRFEKIYEVDGVPITLFEIEEWWETASWEVRRQFLNPDSGDQARYAIAHQIVREMAQKNELEKLEILKTFKKAHQEQRDALGVTIQTRGRFGRGLSYDPDLNRINNQDAIDMSWGGSYNSVPTRSSSPWNIPPRPPDLPNIVSKDPTGHVGSESIFQQAMRMADDKLKREQEAKARAEYARKQAEYVRYEQQQRYYQQSQKTVEPDKKKSWKSILGFDDSATVTKAELVKAFRKKVMKVHPDHGGSDNEFQDLIDARDQALKEIG
jgi:hypothetical protein